MSGSLVEVAPAYGEVVHVWSACASRSKDSQGKDPYLEQKKDFDNSGKFDYSVRNGFPTRLKSKEVKVEQEIMGKETVNAKLSSRAVVKEQRLGDVCLHKRRYTQVETQLERRPSLEQDTDSRSGHVGRVK